MRQICSPASSPMYANGYAYRALSDTKDMPKCLMSAMQKKVGAPSCYSEFREGTECLFLVISERDSEPDLSSGSVSIY